MSTIQKGYLDALGRRRCAPAAALRAIAGAMRTRENRRPHTTVVEEGRRLAVGPAELRLEDGRSLTVDEVLPRDLPAGYHQMCRARRPASALIVAPRACHLPPDLRTWGWAIQLYAARSRRSWGIGDLADLRWLGRWAGRHGAGIALINPLAAPAPTLPQQPSPYFPSSRAFRNPLYLRIEEVPGARDLDVVRTLARQARRLNQERLIDRDAVFALKREALQEIWIRMRLRRYEPLDAFRREMSGLREFATFCALAERFGTRWRSWPPAYRHPAAPAVVRLASSRGMAERVRFHEWVQFELDRQLARATAAMPVMQDLPIGFDAEGADAWIFQDVLAHGVSVGAPPDEFNTRGQNWGLPPFVPHALQAAGYAPFAQTIRACLRHAGGLRIDHVMGLFRLFWIPDGMEPTDGTYVRGNGSDLLAIVALESQRARAVIVGEDLGTVEERARAQLTARRILSYRLFWFEQGATTRYPADALAAITTHDLPTVAGLWSGSDLAAQRALGLSPNEAGTEEMRQRVARMTRAGARTRAPEVVGRVHELLARAPSRILTATLDDAMAVAERPNLPATTDEWPNWRLALPLPINTLPANRLARRIARALSRR